MPSLVDLAVCMNLQTSMLFLFPLRYLDWHWLLLFISLKFVSVWMVSSRMRCLGWVASFLASLPRLEELFLDAADLPDFLGYISNIY